MAGSEVRRQGDSAERHRVAVFDDAIGFDRLICQQVFGERTEIIGATGFHEVRIGGAYDNLRARPLFHRRVTARVIHVRVAVEDELDIADFETKFLDVRANLRHTFLKGRVDENMPLRRGNEPGADTTGTYVINVANDVLWCLLRFPSIEHALRRGVILGRGRGASASGCLVRVGLREGMVGRGDRQNRKPQGKCLAHGVAVYGALAGVRE